MHSARVNTAQNRVSGVVVGSVDTRGAWGEGKAASLDGFPPFTAPGCLPPAVVQDLGLVECVVCASITYRIKWKRSSHLLCMRGQVVPTVHGIHNIHSPQTPPTEVVKISPRILPSAAGKKHPHRGVASSLGGFKGPIHVETLAVRRPEGEAGKGPRRIRRRRQDGARSSRRASLIGGTLSMHAGPAQWTQ